MKPPPPPKSIVSSSPGRAEKLPTPGLSRLLRGKSGSRSRARSSPMFISKSKSVGRSASSMRPTAEEEAEGEPSSPKVTCIGQVRIRRKTKRNHEFVIRSKAQQKLKPKPAPFQCCCNFFRRRAKDGGHLTRRSIWRKWGKWRKKIRSEVKKQDVSLPLQKAESVTETDTDTEKIDDEEEEGETTGFVSSTSTASAAPKNALLLMRCRSAPHNRSSGLAMARFAVSPLPETPKEEEVDGSGGSEEEKRKLSKGSSRDTEEMSDDYSRPATLTRSKSEPAKMGTAKMAVEMEVTYDRRNGSGDC